jgi:hypothetical protein
VGGVMGRLYFVNCIASLKKRKILPKKDEAERL